MVWARDSIAQSLTNSLFCIDSASSKLRWHWWCTTSPTRLYYYQVQIRIFKQEMFGWYMLIGSQSTIRHSFQRQILACHCYSGWCSDLFCLWSEAMIVTLDRDACCYRPAATPIRLSTEVWTEGRSWNHYFLTMSTALSAATSWTLLQRDPS